MNSSEKQNILWHAVSHEIIFKHLESSAEGLQSQEAERRLKKFGSNDLQIKSGENVLWIFFRQFHNSFIYLLLASTVLTLLLGKKTDAAVIFSVVLLNALIGFIQEYRSSKTIQSLLQMVSRTSNVLRDNDIVSISSSEIVSGDILILQAGDRVAADIRLLSVKNLECDESALTGESLPVFKRSNSVSSDASIADRKCMAYNGTLVTAGTGTGVVVATGLHTEFGKISELLSQVAPLETPLSQTLGRIAKWITMAIFLMGIGLFGVGYLRGNSVLDALLASIALAVAAIPEGLPPMITIAASIGVRRMARKKAIIRHLLAVEALGSTTVICTDKTGTLTQNEMTVQSIWTPHGSFYVTGVGYSHEGQIESQNTSEEKSSSDHLNELLTAITLCNDASIDLKENTWVRNGDPTELALLITSQKGGMNIESIREQWPRVDLLPFESEKRIMATLNISTSNTKVIFIKGAPEAIIQLCSSDTQSLMADQIDHMARQGMRVIAVARKELTSSCEFLTDEVLKSDFILLGLLGMIDPPREGVASAIKACQSAHITIKMITGDHPLTASAIGMELRLSHDGKVTLGSELDQLNPDQLREIIEQNHIFARALPEHKLKIVEALQANGHIVAMTGDGVNDAPALKRANIGVAMGISGTAVAKEASDMVLADDNFASIESAVEEGRRVYDNLIKSIAFMFPTSLAQALVVLIAVLFFPIINQVSLLPILPVQILWINLIVAVALALPLAFESMEPDIMQRPPRSPKAPLLSTFIVMRTLMVAAIMAMGTIGVFFWEYFAELGKETPETLALSEAQTMAVTTLMFFQIFYLFNCRSLRFSIFKIGFFSNPYLLFGIGLVVLAQIAFVYLPSMNMLFHSSSLDLEAWFISIGTAIIISPIIALEKWATKRFLIP